MTHHEELIAAADAVVERWHSRDWKQPPTADFIARLSAAVGEARRAAPASEPAMDRNAVLEEAALACENERVEIITDKDEAYNWAIKHSSDAIRRLKLAARYRQSVQGVSAAPALSLYEVQRNAAENAISDGLQRLGLAAPAAQEVPAVPATNYCKICSSSNSLPATESAPPSPSVDQAKRLVGGEVAAMVCGKCGADRSKEPCMRLGDWMSCEMMGRASTGSATSTDGGEGAA